MRRCLRTFGLLLLLVVSSAPPVAAHGGSATNPAQSKILEDYPDQYQYTVADFTTQGYDFYNVYAAEAHDERFGDGLYFRFEAYGDYQKRVPPTAKEYRMTFAFKAGATAVTRHLSTVNGDMFSSDFDDLQAEARGGTLDVERAFISYNRSGLARGANLTGFLFESFVDEEIRDRAPGGWFVPGSMGKTEVPETRSRAIEPYALVGPSKYIRADVRPQVDGAIQIVVTNLFTKALAPDEHQHVHLGLPSRDQAGDWSFEVSGGAAELSSEANTTYIVRATPIAHGGLVRPHFFDVTTDVGGRVGLVVELVDGKAVIHSADLPAKAAAFAEPAVGTPFPPVSAVFWVVAAILALRRRQ